MQPTYLLIHGSWHDGGAWAGVADALRSQGAEVHTPTLAGHGPGADCSVSHADCVDSLVDYVRQHNLHEVVALAHSWGGDRIATPCRNRDETAQTPGLP